MPLTGRDAAIVLLSAVTMEPRWYWNWSVNVRALPGLLARLFASNACT
jgi:hypothetical protein